MPTRCMHRPQSHPGGCLWNRGLSRDATTCESTERPVLRSSGNYKPLYAKRLSVSGESLPSQQLVGVVTSSSLSSPGVEVSRFCSRPTDLSEREGARDWSSSELW
jgi:hypothetical protein